MIDLAPCDCRTWVCVDSWTIAHQLVAGHHPRCPDRGRTLTSAEIIEGLLRRLDAATREGATP